MPTKWASVLHNQTKKRRLEQSDRYHTIGYFSILKRGINGVYHHVGRKHLHRYLSASCGRASFGKPIGCGVRKRPLKRKPRWKRKASASARLSKASGSVAAAKSSSQLSLELGFYAVQLWVF